MGAHRIDYSQPSSGDDQPSFESALSELETIVHQLEEGDLGLAESLARYEQGVKHLKHCYQLLKAAEQKVELLTGVGENGLPITEPFREEPSREDQAGSRRRKRPAAADLSDDEP